MKVIPRSVAVLQTGGQQLFVDIDHTEDSISLGDGTNTLTFQEASPGIWAMPVKPIGGGDASAANQTSGDQKTQIVDAGGVVAEIDDVGGEKAMKVSVISSVGGGAAPAEVDEAAFTAGVSVFTPIGAQFDSDGSDDLTDGQMGALRCTAERALHVHVASGAGGDASAANQTTMIGHIDGIEGLLTTIDADTGAMVVDLAAIEVLLGQIDADTSGIATSTDGIEGLLTTIDADTGSIDTKMSTVIGHVDGIEGLLTTIDTDTGAMVTDLAAIEVLLTTQNGYLDGLEGLLTTIDADTGAIMTAVQIIDNAIAGNEMQVDIVGAPTLTVQGTVAHGSASANNPNQIGLHGRSTTPTAVDDGDVVHALADLGGRQIVARSARDLTINFTGDIATTTEETMLAAGGANVFHDLTQLTLTNAHATDAAVVFLRDATAGSTVWQHSIPAQSGIVIHFDPAMKQTTANNNWTIDMTVSTATIYYSGVAIKRNN